MHYMICNGIRGVLPWDLSETNTSKIRCVSFQDWNFHWLFCFVCVCLIMALKSIETVQVCIHIAFLWAHTTWLGGKIITLFENQGRYRYIVWIIFTHVREDLWVKSSGVQKLVAEHISSSFFFFFFLCKFKTWFQDNLSINFLGLRFSWQ